MYRLPVVLLVLWVMVTVESVEHSRSVRGCPNVRTPLREVRKRRHLAFSEGSNVILTSQIVTAFMTHIPSGWNLATEIDVMFPLPDANFTVVHTQRKKLLHRQKRDLWTRLEDAMSYHNLNGRACVLKSICEAKVFLAPPGKSLVHDILRAIFTLPEMDEEFREEMKGSYEELLTPELCDDIAYCPVSLVHLVLLLNSKP